MVATKVSDLAQRLASVKSFRKCYQLSNENADIMEAMNLLWFNRINEIVYTDRVMSIVEAIKRGDFIPPIYVACGMPFEGNNRFAAYHYCLKNNIPFTMEVIFYDELTEEQLPAITMLINNKQVRWTLPEYLDAYCTLKKDSYLLLREWLKTHEAGFKKKNSYQIQPAIELILGKYDDKAFKDGALVLNREILAKAEEPYKELLLIADAIGNKNCFGRHHIQGWLKARQVVLVDGGSITSFVEKIVTYKRKIKWENPEDSAQKWFVRYLEISVQ